MKIRFYFILLALLGLGACSNSSTSSPEVVASGSSFSGKVAKAGDKLASANGRVVNIYDLKTGKRVALAKFELPVSLLKANALGNTFFVQTAEGKSYNVALDGRFEEVYAEKQMDQTEIEKSNNLFVNDKKIIYDKTFNKFYSEDRRVEIALDAHSDYKGYRLLDDNLALGLASTKAQVLKAAFDKGMNKLTFTADPNYAALTRDYPLAARFFKNEILVLHNDGKLRLGGNLVFDGVKDFDVAGDGKLITLNNEGEILSYDKNLKELLRFDAPEHTKQILGSRIGLDKVYAVTGNLDRSTEIYKVDLAEESTENEQRAVLLAIIEAAEATEKRIRLEEMGKDKLLVSRGKALYRIDGNEVQQIADAVNSFDYEAKTRELSILNYEGYLSVFQTYDDHKQRILVKPRTDFKDILYNTDKELVALCFDENIQPVIDSVANIQGALGTYVGELDVKVLDESGYHFLIKLGDDLIKLAKKK